MNSRFIFKAVIALLLSGGAVAAQTVDEIVNKHVDAMGGAAKLAQLKSVRIAADMEVMNMQVPVTTTIVQDKGFRSETTVQGMTIIQSVNGNTGWAMNPMSGDTKAVALPEEAVKALSAETDLTGLYNYKQKGYVLTLEGEDEVQGAKVYKVSMTVKGGIKRINYISKDTFYILKIVSAGNMGGQEITTENVQSNFKQIDGITFAFTSEVKNSMMPGATMLAKIKSVEVNSKIDESIFQMPK
ncbi:hypothetical protein DYBT9275_00607 [Dyadobacter sp. CECT 9275]|uniref:Uncharacterized protein TP-0789 domain-containing protein n=1 Tax=Dyadobacter helix TaxID=2822344 RepID=A0A916NJS1_9BACT|nr:outer membrane lipoprotein-sorting protein [Dyadobacter sp. CECT 9275]CAG4990762.1 hypothetical protein DYBT9275_00607 [Dyadobacter sp. CECT 9275]